MSNGLLREEILRDIQSNLSPERYQHTLRVEKSAIKLAEQYGYQPKESASLAALLHDNGKYLSPAELLGFCVSYPSDLLLSLEYAPVLHAFAGAVRARKMYPNLPEEIYNAVEYHTTGRPGMSLLEKIIFIADYIEPGRPKLPPFIRARELAVKDPDLCLGCILEQTLSYLRAKKLPIYPLTFRAYQYYTTDNL